MADDFYSFDEALNELKLKEEELKRLVSEGEIRAFRKGDTMKLRRKDVEELRAELDSDIVELGDTVDELVFEDDGDAGMATQELDVETLVDEPEPEPAPAPAPRSASRSSRTRAAADEPAAAPVRRQSAIAAAKAEDEEEPGWVKGLMIVTTLILFLAAPMIMSLLTGRANGFAKGIAGALGNQFEADAEGAPAAEEE